MKQYPSIQHRLDKGLDIIAFDKLDGSNIRAEWTQKAGFNKFGSRKCLIDESMTGEQGLGNAVTVFKREWGEILPPIFKKQKWTGKEMKVTCYFEYFGPKSAFGWHFDEPEDFSLILIDVNIHKRGLLPPKEFIKIFGHLEIPGILYRGKANKTFLDTVRDSTLEGMTHEGVVCKAPHPSKKKTAKPVMFKVKSQAWYDSLMSKCGGDLKEFERLK